MSSLLLVSMSTTAMALDLQVTSEQVVTAVTDAEYDLAVQLATGAIDQLSKLEEPPRPEALATLWQGLGAVGVYDKRAELIGPNFAQACAVDRGWFNERLGSLAQSQWQAACAALDGSGTVTVHPVPEGSVLYADGRKQESETAEVAPGAHLVQVIGDGHEPFVRVVEVRVGEPLTLDPGFAPAATAQAEPEAKRITPFLVGGGVAALAAAGTGGMAWMTNRAVGTGLDDGTYTADNLGDLDADFERYLVLRNAALGCAGVAAVGVGLHFTLR